MEGPSSGRRPETTGSRGGSASGSIGRSAGGCPAAAQTVLRPVGSSARTLARASSELSRPDADSREEAEDIRLQMSSEVPDNGVSAHGGAAACAAANGVTLTKSTLKALAGSGGGGGGYRSNSADQANGSECAVSMGTGESASRPIGLMQDPVQLQWQQMKRQQMVLDGCGGEAEEECWDGSSRNGGAAACAAASERPERQRLPVVAAFSRKRPVRMAPVMRSGAADSEESSEESEEDGENGGAAACAAARIEAIGDELQELQERMADLLMERRGLQEDIRSEEADEQEADDSSSEVEDSGGDGSVSAVRWVEDSSGELEDCSDRMVTVTNVPVPVDELRIGRALSCGQDRIGTMWSEQECSQEGGECTGRVWLQFDEPAYAEEAVQEWHGALYEGRATVVRMGYWLAAGSDGEEGSGGSQEEEEI